MYNFWSWIIGKTQQIYYNRESDFLITYVSYLHSDKV